MGAESSKRCFSSLNHSKKLRFAENKQKSQIAVQTSFQKLGCKDKQQSKTQSTSVCEQHVIQSGKIQENQPKQERNIAEAQLDYQKGMNPEEENFDQLRLYRMLLKGIGEEANSITFAEQSNKEESFYPVNRTRSKTAQQNPIVRANVGQMTKERMMQNNNKIDH